MVCKITSTKAVAALSRGPSPRRSAGFGHAGGFILAEAMVSIGVVSILMIAVCSFTMFSARSFASLFNYVDLDDANRIVMDQLSRDIRQSISVTNFSTTFLTLVDGDTNYLTYTYNPTQRKLYRTKNSLNKVVLTECDSLKFDVRMRNPIGGFFHFF